MKKFIGIVLTLAIVLTGCVSISRECPDAGIWYCEELGVYLDMENSTGMYSDENGEYAPLFVDIDYGTGFYIHFCEETEYDPESGETLSTDYQYKDGILRLADRASGQVYEFIEVDGVLYPGG